MLSWSRLDVDKPITRREMARLLHEKPAVVGDVVEVASGRWEDGRTYEGALELRICAIFRWPGRATQALWLRREPLALEPGAFDRAKLLVEHYWDEHLQWGEIPILREMWKLPMMSRQELEDYRAAKLKRKEAAREIARAHPILDEFGRPKIVDLLEERREASARTGKKIRT